MNTHDYINKFAEKKKKSGGYHYGASLAGGVIGQAAAGIAATPVAVGISKFSYKVARDAVTSGRGRDTNANIEKLRRTMKVPKSVQMYHDTNHQAAYGLSSGNKTFINVPKGSRMSTYAHEMGHASGIGKSTKYTKASGHLRNRGSKIGLATAAFAPTGSTAEKVGYGTVAATQASILAEEGRASVRALKGLKKAGLASKGAKGALAKAFGTYVGGAALTGISGYGLYKGKRLFSRKGDKK
jgi:hypothetical protein